MPSEPPELGRLIRALALAFVRRAPGSAPADGKTLAVGASRYAFASGHLWEVVARDGHPIGFYFAGQGTFTFTPDEPAAAGDLPPGERHDFLVAGSGDDPTVVIGVESLLRASS